MTAPRPHALDRLKERYGLDLTLAELRAVEQRIILGEGMIMRRGAGDNTNVIAIDIGAHVVLVVWAITQRMIVTVVPATNATAAGAKAFRIERRRRST